MGCAAVAETSLAETSLADETGSDPGGAGLTGPGGTEAFDPDLIENPGRRDHHAGQGRVARPLGAGGWQARFR